ncbi:TPA: Eaa protein [Escherichia coli]|nr:Eaa protein [Escherichia coli]
MTTITKERIELFIKNPLENGLTRGEQMELARIALASLEADPVKRVNSDQMRRVCLEANRHLDKYDAMAKEVNKLLGRIAPPAPVVPEEATPENVEMLSGYVSTYKLTDSERDIAAEIWNACRTAMLQSGNFRENKNSSTNNFREIAETSTNYPVIPSEVLSAILKVAKIRADFDDFDGDRRGIGDCLDEAEQELIVTINKYASQLAAEPIAPNDVREQTAIPQVPVTPDGWISCSERMPAQDDWILIYSKHGEYMAGQVQGEYVELSDGTLSWLGNALFWMPLPEPLQEVK